LGSPSGGKAIGLAAILARVNANSVVELGQPAPHRNPFPDEFVAPPNPGTLGDLKPPMIGRAGGFAGPGGFAGLGPVNGFRGRPAIDLALLS